MQLFHGELVNKCVIVVDLLFDSGIVFTMNYRLRGRHEYPAN